MSTEERKEKQNKGEENRGEDRIGEEGKTEQIRSHQTRSDQTRSDQTRSDQIRRREYREKGRKGDIAAASTNIISTSIVCILFTVTSTKLLFAFMKCCLDISTFLL